MPTWPVTLSRTKRPMTSPSRRTPADNPRSFGRKVSPVAQRRALVEPAGHPHARHRDRAAGPDVVRGRVQARPPAHRPLTALLAGLPSQHAPSASRES